MSVAEYAISKESPSYSSRRPASPAHFVSIHSSDSMDMTYCSRRHGRRLGRNAAVTVLGAAPVSIPSRIVSISADIYGLDVVAELTLSWLSLWLNSQ